MRLRRRRGEPDYWQTWSFIRNVPEGEQGQGLGSLR